MSHVPPSRRKRFYLVGGVTGYGVDGKWAETTEGIARMLQVFEEDECMAIDTLSGDELYVDDDGGVEEGGGG